jgi:UDP-N-acetylmuramyl pentapeptide phosphotransferase/UDP-N-acetylglucosamine-1-phosphate transferase
MMWDQLVSAFQSLAGLTGTEGVVAEIGTVWLTVTDYRMWRSLGWLLLGVVMMLIGFVIWNRHAIGAAASTVAAAA